MLKDLNDIQESDEDVWGTPDISFEIETNLEERGEIVRRKYVFNYAKEWNKWTFSGFEEMRADNDARMIHKRQWRRTADIKWYDPEAPDVPVPPEVTDKLEEMLDFDEIVLQPPQP